MGETFPALHLVRSSWSIRMVGRFTFALLGVSTAAMFLAPWQQTSRGFGVVVAIDPQFRPQDVQSQYEGVIKSVKPGLREGSPVTAGDVILELEPIAAQEIDQLKTQVTQLEAARDASKNSLMFAQQNIALQRSSGEVLLQAMRSEVEAARKKWDQAKREVEALQAELNQRTYERNQAEQLYPKGLTSEQDLMDRRFRLEQAIAKLAKARDQDDEFFKLLDSKESELESKRNDLDIKNREAQTKEQQERQKLAEVENKLSELETKLQAFDRLLIRSPRDGTLHKLFGREGSNTVKKGDLLFSVVPDTDKLGVELSVPGRDMPLVSVGDRVRLQFQGWPAVQFVGWPSAAVGTFGGQVLAISPTDDEKGDFSVLVEPDPEQPPWPDSRYLRQGVRAGGWILLNRVTLGFEVWRQLNGFPPTVADKESDKTGSDQDNKGKVKLPK
jgi:multidrug resistance efflux pump